ncbi:hypothetical protein P8452_66192 [Trifolium repens]|nr:hypothetical protein P8452_66192 [Trifolium repens]
MVAAEPQMAWSTKSTCRVELPDRLRWSSRIIRSQWVRRRVWFTLAKQMFLVRWWRGWFRWLRIPATRKFNTGRRQA